MFIPSLDEWRELMLTVSYAAPEIALRTEPVTHQHHEPHLQVATCILKPGEKESQQEKWE
jgi:hypothetical protein